MWVIPINDGNSAGHQARKNFRLRIGDGFNLDGKVKPADFVSPDGEKGIDNNLYRAWGCDAPWRGNGNATLAAARRWCAAAG